MAGEHGVIGDIGVTDDPGGRVVVHPAVDIQAA